MIINIETKLDAIHNGLSELDDYLKPATLDRKILSRLGARVKSDSKKAVRALVTQRTGAMYKGVFTYYNRLMRQQVVSNNAQRDAGKFKKAGRYPWILAAGHRLDPRSGKMLSWGFRDWVEGPGIRYMRSERADDDIEKVLNRELEKLKKKGVLA